MKVTVKKLIPEPALNYGRRWRDQLRSRRGSSLEAVFSEIYSRGLWGDGDYCSGWGSHAAEVVEPYIALVRNWIEDTRPGQVHLVDLGCGDFAIGSRLVDICDSYTGVDIVQPLIERNQVKFSRESVRFVQRDITRDPLPGGNICLLRQVLQHLSNENINAVLKQLEQYEWSLITEHQPDAANLKVANLDRPPQSGTRVRLGSGVFLDRAPFSLPHDRFAVLDDIKAPQGLLRTYLFRGRPEAQVAAS